MSTGLTEQAAVESDPSEEQIAASLTLDLRKVKLAGGATIADRVILAILKVLQIRVPAQSDFPCVSTLAPFVVSREEIPAKALDALQPVISQLSALGFSEAVWHWVSNPLAVADSAFLTMTHAGGQAIARITCHLLRVKKKPVLFVQFFSQTNAGEFLLTWPRGFELACPNDWHIQTLRGKSPEELWSKHREKLHALAQARGAVNISSAQQAAALLDSRQKQLADLQIQHRIFNPLKDAEREKLRRLFQQQDVAGALSAEHADVLAEIGRLQEKTANWGATITILILSLVAFIAAGIGKDKWDMKFLAILVAVLFIHELGHYFAMRLSGYRNLRMFFIPFLGAAVSGQSFNVPGWKKAIVSLMGPVPGILLAIPLGVVGVITGWQTVTLIALILLFINALNLLPLLPLDGGWVMHHVLFCRTVWLDVVFRVITIGLLVAASAAIGDQFLMYIGIAMAIQIPLAYKLAKVVHGLRRDGFQPVSHDDQTIPPEAALPIVERIKAAFPRGLTTRFAAQHTIAVFDNLNARPPGALATVGFLFAHGLSFVMAMLFIIVFGIGMAGGVEGIANAGKMIQQIRANRALFSALDAKVSPATVQKIADMAILGVPPLSVAVNCKSHDDAMKVGRSVLPLLPPKAGCLVFGQTVIVSLPEDDDVARVRIFDELAKDAKDPFIRRPEQNWSLSFEIDSAKGSAALQPLLDWTRHPGVAQIPAPWDPFDQRTAEQKQQDAALGRICRELMEASTQMDLEASTRISQKYSDPIRRGDRDAMKQMQEEQDQLVAAALTQALDRLEKEYPDNQALLTACRVEVAKSGARSLWQKLPELAKPYLRQGLAEEANIHGVRSAGSYSYESQSSIQLSPIILESCGPAAVQHLSDLGYKEVGYYLLCVDDFSAEPFED